MLILRKPSTINALKVINGALTELSQVSIASQVEVDKQDEEILIATAKRQLALDNRDTAERIHTNLSTLIEG